MWFTINNLSVVRISSPWKGLGATNDISTPVQDFREDRQKRGKKPTDFVLNRFLTQNTCRFWRTDVQTLHIFVVYGCKYSLSVYFASIVIAQMIWRVRIQSSWYFREHVFLNGHEKYYCLSKCTVINRGVIVILQSPSRSKITGRRRID